MCVPLISGRIYFFGRICKPFSLIWPNWLCHRSTEASFFIAFISLFHSWALVIYRVQHFLLLQLRGIPFWAFCKHENFLKQNATRTRVQNNICVFEFLGYKSLLQFDPLILSSYGIDLWMGCWSKASSGLDLRMNEWWTMNTFFKGRRGLILNWWKFFKGRWGLILKVDLTKNEESFLDPLGFLEI